MMDERSHRLWGVESGPVTFEHLSARIHPKDLGKVRKVFTATRDISGAYEVDFRILHGKDIRWVRGPSRSATHVMGAFDDDAPEEFLRAALWRVNVSANAQGRGVGRFAIELLQNAHDACADAGRKGAVRFVLTETALLVEKAGGYVVTVEAAVALRPNLAEGPISAPATAESGRKNRWSSPTSSGTPPRSNSRVRHPT